MGKRLWGGLVLIVLLVGCREGDIQNITQGPTDWQGPELRWLAVPDAAVRGTVGLDVAVTDSSAITRVQLFVDGREGEVLTASPYRFSLATDSLTDGVHLCEARAWDAYGNLGISPVLRIYAANGIAEGIRVLWVPDTVATIQSAINAAQDYDTIRVRDGIYHETLNLFGKGIWIESEHGPMHCTVDADFSSRVFVVPLSGATSTIRGFWVRNGNAQISPDQAVLNLYNNIIYSDSGWTNYISSYAGGDIWNNLFYGARSSVQIGYHWGTFYNNIIEFAENTALWNAAVYRNPLVYGYTLFWNNGYNYDMFEPGVGDLNADPQLDLISGQLLTGSPAIDAGNPDITDIDGSRSDIGPFGGPWAY